MVPCQQGDLGAGGGPFGHRHALPIALPIAFWALRGEWLTSGKGLILFRENDKTYKETPFYLAHLLFSEHYGTTLVSSRLEDGPKAQTFSYYTTVNADGNKLYITFINYDASREFPTYITLADFNAKSEAMAFELNCGGDLGPDCINAREAVISSKPLNNISSNFLYLFPPHSVTVLELDRLP